MPALNFKKQFVPAIRAGISKSKNFKLQPKRQTIRAIRKRPIVKGDTLYLYTGMRTRNCALIGEAVCKDARLVSIRPNGTVYLEADKKKHSEIKTEGGRV